MPGYVEHALVNGVLKKIADTECREMIKDIIKRYTDFINSAETLDVIRRVVEEYCEAHNAGNYDYEDLKNRINQMLKRIQQQENMLLDLDADTSNSKISGSMIDGITLECINTGTSAVAIRLTTDSKYVTIKRGVRYRLYLDGEDTRTEKLVNSFRIDLRQSDNYDNIIAYEVTTGGVVFTPTETKNVVLFVMVAPGVTVNAELKPVLKVYEPVIDINEKDSEKTNLVSKFALSDDKVDQGFEIKNFKNGKMSIKGTPDSVKAFGLINSTHRGFKLTKGETYVFSSNNESNITPSANTYRMDLRDESGNILAYETAVNYGMYTATEDAIVTVFIRVGSGYAMNTIIEPKVVNARNLDSIKDSVRICTMNVGNFSSGESGTGSGTDDLYDAFIKTFQKANADIYTFCEWDEYFNKSKGELSDDVFGWLKPYKTNYYDKADGRYVAQMNYSDFPFYYEIVTYYSDEESRHYTDNATIINGKCIHFITTHFPWSTQELRIADMKKLMDYIASKNIEYYVISGDFNMGLDENNPSVLKTQEDILRIASIDVEELEKIGGTSVQGSGFGRKAYKGFINTNAKESPVEVRPYDNIFVSPNIKIKNVFTVNEGASDHFALVADLIIR